MQNIIQTTNPLVSPSWRLALWAAREVGELNETFEKKVASYGAKYDAAASKLSGLGHRDARDAYKATIRSIADGKASVDSVATWETFALKYQLARRAVRANMLAPCREARSLVADMLDRVASKMPALAKRLDASEKALAANSGPDGKSDLVRSVEALAVTLPIRAKKLREMDALCHPSGMLDH